MVFAKHSRLSPATIKEPEDGDTTYVSVILPVVAVATEAENIKEAAKEQPTTSTEGPDGVYGVPCRKASSLGGTRKQDGPNSNAPETKYRDIPSSALELGQLVASGYVKDVLI